jgi:hypothetical protein
MNEELRRSSEELNQVDGVPLVMEARRRGD